APAAYHPPSPRRPTGEFCIAHLNNIFESCSCGGRRVVCAISSLPSIALSRLESKVRTGGSAAPPGDANNDAAFAALLWHRARDCSIHPAIPRLRYRAQSPVRSKTRRGELGQKTFTGSA